MNIVVLLQQVPDPVEELEVDSSGTALDTGAIRYVLNEYDDHALEQGLLLKESLGGNVTAAALDAPDVDEPLFAAFARGADDVVKIQPPVPVTEAHAAARLFEEFLRGRQWDLVLTGVQAGDRMDGCMGALLAVRLGVPYVGVVRGVRPDGSGMTVGKEYPGGILGEIRVHPPAVLGIQASPTPPRYVPIMKIRQAMKSKQISSVAGGLDAGALPPSGITVRKMYKPAETGGAEMIAGTPEDIARRIASLLKERGLV